jgi:hypothetical protein
MKPSERAATRRPAARPGPLRWSGGGSRSVARCSG